jgi:hypothetical protein
MPDTLSRQAQPVRYGFRTWLTYFTIMVTVLGLIKCCNIQSRAANGDVPRSHQLTAASVPTAGEHSWGLPRVDEVRGMAVNIARPPEPVKAKP